jgi:hypothetical protein
MWLGGKLDCCRRNTLGGLIYLQDFFSNQCFLADNGATVSVLLHCSTAPSSGIPLTGEDCCSIPSCGKASKTLSFSLRTFLCSFILAAISKPILGVNFLSLNRLLVGLLSCQVLNAKTLDDDFLHRTKSLQVSRHSLSHASRFGTLIVSFPSIVGNGSVKLCPLHGVKHSIETSGRPILAKARRLVPEKHLTAKAKFRSLEKSGIIRQLNLPWASPLYMVPKPYGSWRPCGDYSRLTMAMVHDQLPSPIHPGPDPQTLQFLFPPGW